MTPTSLLCRAALERLHRSIGTKAGIAKARIRQQVQKIRAALNDKE